MKRTEKEQLVSELKDKIEGATALYYTDFTGLNVKGMTELRRRLRKANVEYVVIKNTLAL
jgi:large subunit ribosomal protein L10